MRILILIIFSLFALQLQAKKPVLDPSVLAPTHGYAFVYYPKGTLGDLAVKSEKDGKQYSLTARSDSGKHNYGAWLPEGIYRVGNWKLQAGGDYPGFEIQAGRLTDLGGLLPVNVGGYETVILPINHAEYKHEIDVAITEFSAYLKSREPILWRPALRPEAFKQAQPSSGLGLVADLLSSYERNKNKPSLISKLKETTTTEEFFNAAKLVTPPLTEEPATDAASNLYFGSDLGQIRVRAADGNWGSIDVQTLHAITAVEFSDKELFSGSDDGYLRVSKDGGLNWSLLKSFGTDESIVDIDHENNFWVVTTVRKVTSVHVQTLDRLSVYVGKQSNFEDLVKSREFPLTQKNLLGWFGADGQLAKDVYYIGTMLELYKLDLKTNTWKEITPPSKVSRHYIDPESGVLSVLLSWGMFSKIFISTDDGASWKQVGRPPYIIYDVAFDDRNKAYALRWNMNAFSGVWEIYSYNATADDWKKTSEAPFNCKPLRVSPKYPLLCISNGASIFSQKNSDWSVEFSAQ